MMQPEPQHMEEKLIPYLEGVLNAKERREVEAAIQSDAELAREMGELRELLLELRRGFASGLKPPQEELSVDEVVDLSYHMGTPDKLPGSSAQKARLFCSDSGLEEYSLLRALSEEMARTTLDRDNVPELPAYLRTEFGKLGKVSEGKPKVLPFLKPSLSAPKASVSLWRRASSWLDRVDPKPLMASAAALAMLSFGVHMYNRPAQVSSTSQEVASAAPSSALEPSSTDTMGKGSVAQVSASPGIEGVAVFTSDDRTLLKDQAAKLLAKKVRYTVTKDRILVAEKDVAVAREVLWNDVEGKEVAMAKEEQAPRRMARTVSSAEPDSGDLDATFSRSEPQASDSQESYDAPSQDGGVTVFRSSGRTDAPPPVPPRRTAAKNSAAGGERASYSSQRDPGAELREGLGSSSPPAATQAQRVLPPPAPSEVVLPATPSQVYLPREVEGAVQPTEVRPPMTAARREKLRDLAVGENSGSSAQASSTAQQVTAADTDTSAALPAAAEERTTLETRARISPPAAPVAAAAPAVSKVDEVDSRLIRAQTARQEVARKHGVELSLERQNDKLVAYVRPNRALDKAQLDELRKVLRKDLGLAESDTLIFR